MIIAVPATETWEAMAPGWGRKRDYIWDTSRPVVEGGHMQPPEPGAPRVFSMGSDERAQAMLEDAGLADVRIEEIAVRFTFSDVDDYVSFAVDTAGPFEMVIRGLSEGGRQTIEAQLGEAFAPFAADGGYELPGVALAAVAS